MLYLCFVMFRFKCQTVLEAIAVKIKMYDPRDEAKSKGELPFVVMGWMGRGRDGLVQWAMHFLQKPTDINYSNN